MIDGRLLPDIRTCRPARSGNDGADQRVYGDRVHPRRSASQRGTFFWPLLAVAASLAGAAALCVVGLLAVTENYDGVTSLINPVAVGSCCAALVLVMAAPLAWWVVYDDNRDR